MKKAILIIKTNFRVYGRINSENNPLMYVWLRSKGIKIPPEILAYLIMLCFLQMMVLGFISEMNDVSNKNPNLFYSSILFFISTIAVEILIAGKKLQINPNLLKVLPFTKKNYISYILINHFVSLRLWNLITFIIFFWIFANTYNNETSFKDYIDPTILWIDLFLIFNSITLFLKDIIKNTINNKNVKITLPIRLFFILLFFIIINRISKYSIKGKISEVFPVYIENHLIFITLLSLIIPACLITYYFNTKSTSIS